MTDQATRTARVVLVAAVADNGVIGNGPDIPWRIPGEQAEFKALTMGHTLVMGRATFDSIGRPLPGRTTVVLTRDPDWSHDQVLTAPSIQAALDLAATLPGDTMVVGGGQVYDAAIQFATDQVLSRVHLEPDGDVFYPEFDPADWTETAREPHPASDGVAAYDRVFLTRRDIGG